MRKPMMAIAAAGLLVVGVAGGMLFGSNVPASSSQAKGGPPMPKIVNDTPDNALKTYWQLRDHIDWSGSDLGRRQELRFQGELSQLTITGLFKGMGDPEEVSRDIISVDQETASRAVILTRFRNVSPIPEGVEVGDYEKRKRADGDLYRYVMTSEGGKWKVAEIWEFDDLIEEDWVKRLPSEGGYAPFGTLGAI